MAWPPGKTLCNGKYTIVRTLGEGAYGITYLVEDDATPKNQFALKTLSERLLLHRDRNRFQDRLVEEISRLRECNNPHIVKVEGQFTEDSENVVCILLEYVGGRSLAQFPPNELPLGEKVALEYIRQIGEALIEVHRHQLVHRDIKRENIILRANGRKAVLIDFGLVRKFEHPLTTKTVVSSKAKGFSAPEMSKPGEPCGAYTDIYSLAAVFYFLLIGEVPPDARDRDRADDPLESQIQSCDRLKPKFKKAILWAMQMNPKNRPQTMKQWLNFLGVSWLNFWGQELILWWKCLGIEQKFTFLSLLIAFLGLLIAFATFVLGIPEKIEQWLELFGEKQEQLKDEVPKTKKSE